MKTSVNERLLPWDRRPAHGQRHTSVCDPFDDPLADTVTPPVNAGRQAYRIYEYT
jgi:hypothetical protein